jgi:hypothetical protein
MNDVEKVARAMARADDVDPDQPLGQWSMKRIVGKGMVINKYDRNLPAWNYYIPLAKVFIAASAALNKN